MFRWYRNGVNMPSQTGHGLWFRNGWEGTTEFYVVAVNRDNPQYYVVSETIQVEFYRTFLQSVDQRFIPIFFRLFGWVPYPLSWGTLVFYPLLFILFFPILATIEAVNRIFR